MWQTILNRKQPKSASSGTFPRIADDSAVEIEAGGPSAQSAAGSNLQLPGAAVAASAAAASGMGSMDAESAKRVQEAKKRILASRKRSATAAPVSSSLHSFMREAGLPMITENSLQRLREVKERQDFQMSANPISVPPPASSNASQKSPGIPLSPSSTSLNTGKPMRRSVGTYGSPSPVGSGAVPPSITSGQVAAAASTDSNKAAWNAVLERQRAHKAMGVRAMKGRGPGYAVATAPAGQPRNPVSVTVQTINFKFDHGLRAQELNSLLSSLRLQSAPSGPNDFECESEAELAYLDGAAQELDYDIGSEIEGRMAPAPPTPGVDELFRELEEEYFRVQQQNGPVYTGTSQSPSTEMPRVSSRTSSHSNRDVDTVPVLQSPNLGPRGYSPQVNFSASPNEELVFTAHPPKNLLKLITTLPPQSPRNQQGQSSGSTPLTPDVQSPDRTRRYDAITSGHSAFVASRPFATDDMHGPYVNRRPGKG